jgi:uncharacterized membrane protein
MALVLIFGSILALRSGIKAVAAQPRSGRAMRIGFGATLALALAVGIRFCALGDFQISERVRVQGAPIPVVVFVLEEQEWVDFVKPSFVGYPCMAANTLFPVGLIGLFWVLAAKRSQKEVEAGRRPVPSGGNGHQRE